VLDGVYKFSIWEQSQRGFDEQILEAIDILPALPGLKWVTILGNHDETFADKSGIDVSSSMMGSFRAYGREDLLCVGARGAYVRLMGSDTENSRGLLCELHHPKGSPAYSISYKPQRHVEQYPPGQKPDVYISGHFHQIGYILYRGVHCLQAGTFQGGRSAYGKSLGGAPSIGGWIVKYGLTPEGTVRPFVPEMLPYYEIEEPRSISLG
jgi:hypothetical protein